MATLACFFRPFAWKVVFQPFTLKQCLSFSLKWVSCMQQNVGSCLCNQFVSLCLFIGELSPLILRDIEEQSLLLPVYSWASFLFFGLGKSSFIIFLLEVELCLCGFVERLLSCIFQCVVSLLVLEFSIYYSFKGWICGKILYKFGFLMDYLGFSIYIN